MSISDRMKPLVETNEAESNVAYAVKALRKATSAWLAAVEDLDEAVQANREALPDDVVEFLTQLSPGEQSEGMMALVASLQTAHKKLGA
jgi:hypothetical protein